MEPRSRNVNFRKLLRFARPYATRLATALGLTVLLAFLEMAPPLITMYIVDEVIVVGRWEMLEAALALLILTPALAAGLRVANAFTFSYVSNRLIMNVRLTLYEHVFRLSLGYHDEMGTGKVMSRMMGDVATVQQMVSDANAARDNGFRIDHRGGGDLLWAELEAGAPDDRSDSPVHCQLQDFRRADTRFKPGVAAENGRCVRGSAGEAERGQGW